MKYGKEQRKWVDLIWACAMMTHQETGTIHNFDSWTWVFWANLRLESCSVMGPMMKNPAYGLKLMLVNLAVNMRNKLPNIVP